MVLAIEKTQRAINSLDRSEINTSPFSCFKNILPRKNTIFNNVGKGWNSHAE